MVFNSNTVPKRSNSSPLSGSLFPKKDSELNQMPKGWLTILVGETGGTGGTSNSKTSNKTIKPTSSCRTNLV